jgi:hypothetical protein
MLTVRLLNTLRLSRKASFCVKQFQCYSRPLTTSTGPQQAAISPVNLNHSTNTDNHTVAALGRTKSGTSLKIRKYPTFTDPEDERTYRKQHLAAAYRVFAERGFDEGVAGHISVRDPILTDHFCKPCPVRPLLGRIHTINKLSINDI